MIIQIALITFLTVQFFASSDSIQFNNNELNDDLIFCIRENSLYKYFYGKSKSYNKIKNLQNKLKKYGFFDSFIVGFFNKNKAELSKVLSILDKEND